MPIPAILFAAWGAIMLLATLFGAIDERVARFVPWFITLPIGLSIALLYFGIAHLAYYFERVADSTERICDLLKSSSVAAPRPTEASLASPTETSGGRWDCAACGKANFGRDPTCVFCHATRNI